VAILVRCDSDEARKRAPHYISAAKPAARSNLFESLLGLFQLVACRLDTRARVLAYGSHGFSYYAATLQHVARMNNAVGVFRCINVANRSSCFAKIASAGGLEEETAPAGGKIVNRCARIVGVGILVGTLLIYATCGHTAAELSNPVSPAEDWRDASINLLPHIQFTGSGIYEFLPGLSRGNAVPTPTPLAEYTTVELNYGAGKAFEAALAGEQSKLQGETLWYRLVEGGNAPRYVRLRPRTSLASILDEHADQPLPEKVSGLISKMTVETWNLLPNMLVNVTPEPAR